MSESPNRPDHTKAPEAELVCCACGYDLRGLPRDGVCPECSMEIQSSIHASLELKNAEEMHRLPLPSWLRIAKSAYLAAAVILLSAPWALPWVAELFGLPAKTGRHSQFPITLAICCLPTAMFGFMLGAMLAGSGSRWSVLVLGSVLLLFFVGWQSVLIW